MKLPLSPLQYMLIVTSLYLVAGLANLFVYKFAQLEHIQAVWLLILSIPVWAKIPKLVKNTPLWKL